MIGGFVPWEKRLVLLAARWAIDVFHAFRSRRGPLWWRQRALLDSGPVKVHEDYWAAHIKTDHTNGITHHPGSSVAASGRIGDRQHKQTTFVLAVSRSEPLSLTAGILKRRSHLSCVRLFRFTYGDGTKSHLENNVIFIFFRQRWGWLVKLCRHSTFWGQIRFGIHWLELQIMNLLNMIKNYFLN